MLKQLVIIILVGALFVLSAELYALQLRDVSFFTGWGLVSMGVLMASLIVARHCHHSISAFSQRFYHSAHLVIGWVMLLVFLLHIEFKLPSGLLETTLALLFTIIILSGIFGLFFDMFAQDKDLSEEKVLIYREQLLNDANDIVIMAIENTGDTQLAEFYSRNIEKYFNTIPRWFSLIVSRQKSLAPLLQALQTQTKEQPLHQQSFNELRKLIHKKSKLERQYMRLSLFSSWFTIHQYTTYLLIVFVLLHIILVHTFAG